MRNRRGWFVTALDQVPERPLVARLTADRDAADAGTRRGCLRGDERGREGALVPRGELQDAELFLGPALGERRRVPQHEGVEPVAAVHQRRVAETELRGEQDLPREVRARGERPDEPGGRRGRGLLRGRGALRQERRGGVTTRREIARHRHREVARSEPEAPVEADVLDRARHRLEAHGGDVLVHQPVHRGPHGRLADPHALPVGADRERAHPPLGARAVRYVEGDDLSRLVAPHHRAVARVEQRVAPHLGIEMRHPHADQAVTAVAVGERVGEHPVQALDVALDGTSGA